MPLGAFKQKRTCYLTGLVTKIGKRESKGKAATKDCEKLCGNCKCSIPRITCVKIKR